MKRQLPKNVRQIGNVSDSSKIYVEDYVDTYFNQLCEKADSEMIGAFLIGETVQEEEQDYIYVYGAIRMKELGVKGKDFVISDQVWKHACETCKEYFGNAEILGWFITGGERPLEVNHNISKVHQKYFSREKSLFVTKNVRDKEEKFYIYKYRDMMECNGHYIYYEKNAEMQNYMISTRKKAGLTPSEIIEDRVTKNFRSIIREKNEKNNQKNHSRMIYAMSTFLVLVILIIGVSMINNYDKMQNIKNGLEEDAESLVSEEESVEAVGDSVTAQIEDDTEDEAEEDTEQNAENNGEQQQQTEEVAGENAENEETPSEEPVVENEIPETTQTSSETYVVQKGDTLESISREKYGDVSRVKKICELNGLEDGNLIYIGQKLLLP